MKFSIKDFFSKYDQIHSFLRIWLHSLKKSLMKNLIFCAVYITFFIFHMGRLAQWDSKVLGLNSTDWLARLDWAVVPNH